MITLSPDQSAALEAILAANAPGSFYLLTGYAGSGKTTLMQEVARRLKDRSLSVAMTAPTHKAVAVLARKLREAGMPDIACLTLHALLSLKPKPHGDRLVFQRSKRADPVTYDVIVIDECSMVSADLMVHINRHLPNSFVLFVGDPAQLPPVGEKESQTFATKARCHLDTIIRQAAGNPILDAAHTIRTSQGGPIDMSWCRSANAPPLGVFMPGRSAGNWIKKAFTSADFDADPDFSRYLCWTNDRVAEINQQVRGWRYGDNLPTPFMPGEMALVRAPVIRENTILLNTNDEARVLTIEPSTFQRRFNDCDGFDGWIADLETWAVTLRRGSDEPIQVHMIRHEAAYNRIIARITDEARECRDRWGDLHGFKSSLARLQSIYAMTVHTSQGSTFTNTFVDVADISRRAKSNVLEAQQLFYVAATRASRALMLVNA